MMARNFVAANPDFIDLGTGVRGTDLLGILAMCWINRASSGAEHKALARWGTGVTEQYLLGVSAGNFAEWIALDTSFTGHTCLGTTTITTGTWFHIAGLYYGNFMSVYVNGSQELRINPAVMMNNGVAGTHTFIGKAADGNPFNGQICEAALILTNPGIGTEAGYGRVIKAAAQGAGIAELDGMYDTELIGYWPLLGDSPEPDYGSGSGVSRVPNPGTLTGTTVKPHPGIASIISFGRSRENASGSGIA